MLRVHQDRGVEEDGEGQVEEEKEEGRGQGETHMQEGGDEVKTQGHLEPMRCV